MSETGKGSYLWHLSKAARLELVGDRHQRRGFLRDAADAREKAKAHRAAAAVIDLERRAAA